MSTDRILTFDRYHLDLVKSQLFRGKRAIELPKQTSAVLRYLVEHAGQVVSKDELFAALWPGTAVSDGALTFCIVELRKALRDNAKHPKFIETVHRRGYRFIGKVVSRQHPVASSKDGARDLRLEPSPISPPVSNLQSLASLVVGRDTDLAFLHQLLEKSLNGERQVIFVTGEPGIGKTTLMEAFVHTLTATLWVAQGQCIEQYGPGEPYMPILEAVGRLCRTPDGKQLVMLLQRYAPTWLVQMPSLLNVTELEALQRQTQGATRERMLREMGEAIEAITAERPLVLVLEDLHWSDASTVELLSLLARRREPARLLVIGTYRPVDVIVQEHPLRAVKQELQLHGLCIELPLGLLSEAQVAEYLAQRFGAGLSDQSTFHLLAKALHQRTDGNPLFMVSAMDDIVSQGGLDPFDPRLQLPEVLASVETRVPESIQQLIERHIERLSVEDRRLLEVASVAGLEFSAAAVAAGSETTTEDLEDRCASLAQQNRFLRASGTAEWPDGTVAARYSFLHALYQEVLYPRIPAGRQQRLHLRIGERLEASYGKHAREIAAELAVHFEQGRDYRKAVHYLQAAGETALRQSAHHEASMHLTRGVDLLKRLPDTPERARQELQLLNLLGSTLISIKGDGVIEVEHLYTRAYELCEYSENALQLIEVLSGLQTFYLMRGKVQNAREAAERVLQRALHIATPTALMTAHGVLGESVLIQGEVALAREHFEQAWSLYTHHSSPLFVPQSWIDPGVVYLSYLALTLWFLGYPDEAQRRLQESLKLAEELSHPFSRASALITACFFHTLHQEWHHATACADAVITLSTEHEFPFWLAYGTAMRGRVLLANGRGEESLAQIRQGLTFFRSTGAELVRIRQLPWLAMAYKEAGRLEDGLAVLAEALTFADTNGAHVEEAELHRVKGELTLQQESKEQRAKSGKQEAEECFLKAIDIARKQQAKSWELRASISLARLWQRQGKTTEAHKLLSDIYNWFTEGFATKDLQEAKALIETLKY